MERQFKPWLGTNEVGQRSFRRVLQLSFPLRGWTWHQSRRTDRRSQGLKEFRHLYENEVITVDALLQAEVDWKRAEVSYTAALFDGKISQATLRKALGEFAEWVEKHHE